MNDPELPKNPLLDVYFCTDPGNELATHEQASNALREILPELLEVIPEVEIPHMSPILGIVCDRDSDSAHLQSPEVPYPTPDGATRYIQLTILRPRVLNNLGVNSNEWSTLNLNVDDAPYLSFGRGRWIRVAQLSHDWGFTKKNSRGVECRGTINELSHFIAACRYVRDNS